MVRRRNNYVWRADSLYSETARRVKGDERHRQHRAFKSSRTCTSEPKNSECPRQLALCRQKVHQDAQAIQRHNALGHIFDALDATAAAATAPTSAYASAVAASGAASCRVLLAGLGLGCIIDQQGVKGKRVREDEVANIVPAN